MGERGAARRAGACVTTRGASGGDWRSIVGWAFVAAGVVLNPFTVGLLAADGGIESTRVRAAVFAVEGFCVLVGLAVLLGWDRVLARSGVGVRMTAAVLVLGGSLAAAEGLVRLVMGPRERWAPPPTYVGEIANRPSENFVGDSLVGWRMRPGVEFRWIIDGAETTYRATVEGFRSSYASDDLPPDAAVVAVVGDSFAFGTGVEHEQVFTTLLDATSERIVVHNLALPGMGMDQMWMVARHRALPLRPRLVVVAFIDQDFDRSLTAFRVVEGMSKPTFVVDGGGLRPAAAADAPPPLWRWLERRSALVGLGRAVDRAAGYRFGLGTWWSTNAAILREMAREARAAGSEILFVRMPMRRAPSFPALPRLMTELGTVFVDLNSGAPPDIHFATDDHIDAAGHAYVARALEPLVLRLALD